VKTPHCLPATRTPANPWNRGFLVVASALLLIVSTAGGPLLAQHRATGPSHSAGQTSSGLNSTQNARKPPAWTVTSCPVAGAQLYDRTFFSHVFGEERHYRIFLPANYNSVSTRYPVIYYFHGHSDRYTLEDYDHGTDTVPKICRFVATHPVIVVAWDGYVARNYTGFYGGDPYDVRLQNGVVDFGKYFLEQVHTIDTHYRTLTTRRFRATSGLSMGGFMSLYLGARYPDIIGSSSAFNPGPEFYVGEIGRRSLWRPKDYVLSFEHTPIRLVHASGDFISQYTEETEAAFAAAPTVPFEYRQDEYDRHWATSIGETFAFHMRAFADPALDATPTHWNYASAFETFDVWGYRLHADIAGPAVIYLKHVSKAGLFIQTRRWAPDGPSAACTSVDLTTAPLYQPGGKFKAFDYSLKDNASTSRELVADPQGRLHLSTDCSGHEFGISGPGIDAQQPAVLLPVTTKDFLRRMPGSPTSIPIRFWNPGAAPLKNLHVALSSDYPTVDILHGSALVTGIDAGQAVDLGPDFLVQFTAGSGEFARTRLDLNASTLTGKNKQEALRSPTYIDVMVAPSTLSAPPAMAVLDGRTKTFPIFWQGVHGGGVSVPRTVTEGKGNGNGVLEPGEQATIWVQVAQGLDPFDKENWCRTKVYTDSPWIEETADLQEDKRREWTGAQNRTSVIELNPATPKGTEVDAILDCETYSYYFTPDVRYGKLPLYQPFQLHRHELFLWKWKVGEPQN
jgi:pimeloyl-ACP methyl ester carboxylesterase